MTLEAVVLYRQTGDGSFYPDEYHNLVINFCDEASSFPLTPLKMPKVKASVTSLHRGYG